MGDAVYRIGVREEHAGPQPQPLDHIMPEMLVEPRPPGCPHGVAGLQHRAHARPAAAPHQAEMAAMAVGHHLEDGIRLPVTPRAEHDALVGPFHAARSGYCSEYS